MGLVGSVISEVHDASSTISLLSREYFRPGVHIYRHIKIDIHIYTVIYSQQFPRYLMLVEDLVSRCVKLSEA